MPSHFHDMLFACTLHVNNTRSMVHRFETVGGFVYSDQFIQISSLLPTHLNYGLGENRAPFLKDTHWSQISIWNADQWPALGVSRPILFMS